MNTDTTLPLPVDLHSPEQLGLVTLELRNLVAHQRKAAIQAKVTSQRAAAHPHLSILLTQLLDSLKIEMHEIDKLDGLYGKLEDLRKKAPSVRMTLTALPTRTHKRQFTGWFRTNVHPQTLVSYTVRTDIGGGATLIAGSHIYDFSFREQLLKNKARITGIFDGVRK